MKSKTFFLSLFLVLLSTFGSAQSGPPGLPQEFEGEVTINDAKASQQRSFYVQVGDEGAREAAVDENGGYEVLLSGDDGNPVRFYIENEADEQFEAVTDPENPTFESGGSVQRVDLDFTIEDPDPVTKTLEVENKSTDYSVLRTETRFVDDGTLYFEYGEEGRGLHRETESLQIEDQGSDSEITEIKVNGLEPNTGYEYKAVLNTDQGMYEGDMKSFTTDNLPPLTVKGTTNTTDTDVEALIDGKIVQEDYIDSTGTFDIEISYNSSFVDEQVTIRVKDEEKILEFQSGETKKVNFQIEKENVQSKDENQTVETEETSNQEDSGQRAEDQQNESNSQETVPYQNAERGEESPESLETDQNQSLSQNQSLTGEFFEGQVNEGTTIISFMLLATLAFLTNELI